MLAVVYVAGEETINGKGASERRGVEINASLIIKKPCGV